MAGASIWELLNCELLKCCVLLHFQPVNVSCFIGFNMLSGALMNLATTPLGFLISMDSSPQMPLILFHFWVPWSWRCILGVIWSHPNQFHSNLLHNFSVSWAEHYWFMECGEIVLFHVSSIKQVLFTQIWKNIKADLQLAFQSRKWKRHPLKSL